MPQFCMLFYAKYTILANQRGGHGPNPLPRNTPLITLSCDRNIELTRHPTNQQANSTSETSAY